MCAWLPLAFCLGAVMVMHVALCFWQRCRGVHRALALVCRVVLRSAAAVQAVAVCPPLVVAALPFWLLALVVVALPFWRTVRLGLALSLKGLPLFALLACAGVLHESHVLSCEVVCLLHVAHSVVAACLPLFLWAVSVSVAFMACRGVRHHGLRSVQALR